MLLVKILIKDVIRPTAFIPEVLQPPIDKKAEAEVDNSDEQVDFEHGGTGETGKEVVDDERSGTGLRRQRMEGPFQKPRRWLKASSEFLRHKILMTLRLDINTEKVFQALSTGVIAFPRLVCRQTLRFKQHPENVTFMHIRFLAVCLCIYFVAQI